ncbi:MAG: YggS family pyridoxal phosphate-dependent enzyme [Clostridia bacterium]|nr:YggS family pyridoxal phosphate-dependent enzyme [Clostridia bacterium]
MTVKDNYEKIRARVRAAAEKCGRDPDEIEIVCVSKSVDENTAAEAVAAGVKIIGENRAPEFLKKYEALHDKAKCHFIGHLQTNKASKIVGRADLIQSLDSIKLARELSRIAENRGITVDTLVEINISGDENKYGIKKEELDDFLSEIAKIPNIRVRGLMSIGPLHGDEEKTRRCFMDMYKLFIDTRAKKYDNIKDNIKMEVLSLGMSGDFELAIECGSNMVRVGTAFFENLNNG